MVLASKTAEWLTAFGTLFAAIGTVGAVVIALWQTRRRIKYSVAVTCRTALVGDADIGELLSLQATNTGERLVRLTMAYLLTDSRHAVVAKFYTPGTEGASVAASIERSGLPVSLVDGESVTVQWQRSTLDTLRQREGFDHYMCAYFTDPLGNMYAAPYPGMTVKRKGLRRRKTYVRDSAH